MIKKKGLSVKQREDLLRTLKARFEKNMSRHKGLEWAEVQATPADVRKLGGALFGDRRYGRVFVFHNGADSYYAGRGFRGSLKV